jgi:hypothetical protein
MLMVPPVGLEPTLLAEPHFECGASTNSTTGARPCGTAGAQSSGGWCAVNARWRVRGAAGRADHPQFSGWFAGAGRGQLRIPAGPPCGHGLCSSKPQALPLGAVAAIRRRRADPGRGQGLGRSAVRAATSGIGGRGALGTGSYQKVAVDQSSARSTSIAL